LPIAKWLRSKLFWISLAVASFVGYRFYVEYLRVAATPLISWQKQSRADCAVVLTGGSGRVREGFDLLTNKQVKKLIISGVYQNARLREIMPLWAMYGNLSEVDVVLEKRSETTFGNAQQSLPIVEALRCRDILLVTSRVHMHRAHATFKATFPSNIYIYPHAVVGGRYQPSVWEVALETMKSLFYTVWAF